MNQVFRGPYSESVRSRAWEFEAGAVSKRSSFAGVVLAAALLCLDLRLTSIHEGLEGLGFLPHLVAASIFGCLGLLLVSSGTKVRLGPSVAGLVVFASFALLSSLQPGRSLYGSGVWLYNASVLFGCVLFVSAYGWPRYISVFRTVSAAGCCIALLIGLLGLLGVQIGPVMPPLFGDNPRLVGLSAHPNTLGQLGMVAILSNLRGFFSSDSRSRMYCLVGLAVLLWSGSRTTLIACVATISIALWMHHQGNTILRRTLLIALVIGAVTVSLVASVEATDLSRSGNSKEEITTLTGRTGIWGEALAMSKESKLYGFGFYDGGVILSEIVEERHGQKGVIHPHNSVIQALFVAGPLGLLGFVLSSAIALFKSLSKPAFDLRRLVVITGLFLGLTESIMGSSTPWVFTALWFGAVASLGYRDP